MLSSIVFDLNLLVLGKEFNKQILKWSQSSKKETNYITIGRWWRFDVMHCLIPLVERNLLLFLADYLTLLKMKTVCLKSKWIFQKFITEVGWRHASSVFSASVLRWKRRRSSSGGKKIEVTLSERKSCHQLFIPNSHWLQSTFISA